MGLHCLLVQQSTFLRVRALTYQANHKTVLLYNTFVT